MWLYNAFIHSDDWQKNTSSHIIIASDYQYQICVDKDAGYKQLQLPSNIHDQTGKLIYIFQKICKT